MVGVALLLGAMLVAACNTVEGVGRDVRAAGNAIEGAAKDAKR
ncbi:MAG: entericidin A/B family lipoprotein [Alphaproteobacteria bacterium]|nr:entericidin A/B family lipoprotein [Alphaproteobacteria bacterium]MCW5752748.1 entericidin A/B family lipoprotein [Alphaproteobacteria bacterium]